MAEVAQVRSDISSLHPIRITKLVHAICRYSAFIALYPPGFLSEAWLVYLSLTQAANVSLPYRVYLLLGFLSYIPGKPPVREFSQCIIC